MTEKGRLYVCGTPIGNLDDVSFRLIKVLKKVDLIAAEDTRRTRQLLNYYEINNSLTSYHEHNEHKKTEELLELLKGGKDIALVSDAGIPGISDPGEILINKVISRGYEVIPVPGPNAALLALVVSGLPMDRFVFEGFLPRKGKEREERLKKIQEEERTVILYESPYRINSTLKELLSYLGKRKVALIRELTKVYEEKIYGTIEEILKQIDERALKGEIVLVIEGVKTPELKEEWWKGLSIVEHLELLINKGLTKKMAIKEVAKTRGIPRREVYKEAVVINVNRGKSDNLTRYE